MNTYEILESTSELKIRVFGTNLMELFGNALYAMFDCIEPSYGENEQEAEHNVTLTASDGEQLLIDFLAEALYFSDINNEAFYKARFDYLTNMSLDAVIIGRKVSGFAIEIKAVTHHEVRIVKKEGKLYTDILFDI